MQYHIYARFSSGALGSRSPLRHAAGRYRVRPHAAGTHRAAAPRLALDTSADGEMPCLQD